MNSIFQSGILLLSSKNIVFKFVIRHLSLSPPFKGEKSPRISQLSSSQRFNLENDALFGPIRKLAHSNKLPKSQTDEAGSEIKLESFSNVNEISGSDSAKSISNVNEISGSDLAKQQVNFPLTFNNEHNFEQQADVLKLTSLTSTSITKILNATMSEESKEILKKWREAKIKKLGEEGFKIYQTALFTNGKNFHTAIFEYLSGQTTLEEVALPVENQGHWESLQHIFQKIESPTVLEKHVAHPYLKYHGIVDCVCNISGQLVVIDWKTSEKKKSSIKQLYDNPLQVSAYMGAINFDPSFENQDLQKGAVIIAYESGEPADIFTFDCEKYWKLWLQRLALFHFSNQKAEANIQQ